MHNALFELSLKIYIIEFLSSLIKKKTMVSGRKKGTKEKKKKSWQPLERFELPTPGLQDQCSNHWATEAPRGDDALYYSFIRVRIQRHYFYPPPNCSLTSQTLSVPQHRSLQYWPHTESDRHCGRERVWLARLAQLRDRNCPDSFFHVTRIWETGYETFD